ncbi:MAG: hypothetical protein ACO2PP_04235 [Thermocrinis sp.]|jgi:hypothetical protein|uniref:hypothetical protein n=1 Tax=Thermocrinis sp. TaxID=2024383 RepID=UPI003BFEE652
MKRGRLEVSVYWKDEIGQCFKPYFYRKFVMEAELELKEGLVRVYRLENQCYLGIVFVDGKVRDGLTVVRERKRNDWWPVAYVDEVGNYVIAEWDKEKLLRKIAWLRRYVKEFMDRSMMPIKEGNIDPVDADIYWNILDLGMETSQDGLVPFLELKTKMGGVHFYLLKRLGRDNIDLYIGVNPVGRKILVQGKAGETYLVEKASIPKIASLESAIHFVQKVNENFGIEEVIVLDEKVYTKTGLPSHLSGIAKMVA